MRDSSSIRFDDDASLMIKAQGGDRQAYARLYHKYAPVVREYVAACDERAEAKEDLVQEVFARIWERRDRYQPGTAVCPYMLGFARNVFREHRERASRERRGNSREPVPAAENLDPGPAAAAQRSDQATWVRSQIAGLPPKQRQALELVYLVQLPVAEAARVMDCSPEALRQFLYEARQRLETTFFFADEVFPLP